MLAAAVTLKEAEVGRLRVVVGDLAREVNRLYGNNEVMEKHSDTIASAQKGLLKPCEEKS